MFSRYRSVPMAAAMLICLAAIIISSVTDSRPCLAKSSVQVMLASGDPDEFETRVYDPNGGGVSKTALSGDASAARPRTEFGAPLPEVRSGPAEAPGSWHEILVRAVRRFARLVVIELDLM